MYILYMTDADVNRVPVNKLNNVMYKVQMEDQNQKWINVINACTIFACTIFCSLLCFLFFLLCCIHVCVHVHMMCTFFRWSCYRYYRDDECPSWKVEAHHACTIPFCRVPLWTLYCSLHHTNPTPRFTSRQEALGTNTFPTVVLPVPLPCLPFGPTIGLQQKQKEQNKH
jgi:hypothetical protein